MRPLENSARSQSSPSAFLTVKRTEILSPARKRPPEAEPPLKLAMVNAMPGSDSPRVYAVFVGPAPPGGPGGPCSPSSPVHAAANTATIAARAQVLEERSRATRRDGSLH